MARINEFAGRDVLVYVGEGIIGARICARTKTVTLVRESIAITKDCDGTFRKLLDEPASRFLDMSIEGVLAQDDWLKQALDTSSNTFLNVYTLVIPGVGSITGDFFISDFELGAPHDDAVTFTATVQSSGEWTFTPET